MSGRSVYVANAGTHPEPNALAASFAAHGELRGLFTASMWPSQSVIGALSRRLPGSLAGSLISQRILPAGIGRRETTNVAGAREAAFQVALRLSPSWAPRVLSWRNSAFHGRVARSIAATTGDRPVVVAQSTSALGAFRAAPPDAVRVLMYPLPEHRWMNDYLDVEARENPEWAVALQGHRPSPERLRLLDEEIERSDILIVPSTFAASTFDAELHSPIVSPLGVSPEYLRDTPAHRLRASSGLNLLFVGQVNQRKGISYLLDAFDETRRPGDQLRIAGRVPSSIAGRLEGRPGVSLLGVLSRSDLRSAMEMSDALVLPTLADGFGLVILEAMASGLPAIVSTHSAAADIVDHRSNGWIVRPRSTSDLSEAFRHFQENPEMTQAMADRARVDAIQHTWERYGSKTRKLLTERLA